MKRRNSVWLLACLGALACTGPAAESSDPVAAGDAVAPVTAEAPGPAAGSSLDPSPYADLEGSVVVDGSSTVFPITEKVAALFESLAPTASVSVGVSGTGGGFEKFCQGQIDITGASRPIKTAEAERCEATGIRPVELPLAFDGLSVVVHGDNGWCSCLTVDELARIWHPDAEDRLLRWRQLRPEWPDEPIRLYGPGRDSGTFDYFTRAILGTEGESRNDFVGSEDDYLLAQDISKDPGALGFFGHAYYHEHRDRLNLVAIDGGAGCVVPDVEAIGAGRYRPLSRPVFLYVAAAALDRPAVSRFVDLYLSQARYLAPEMRYVPLPEGAYELARQRLARRLIGSVFDGGSQVGVSIERLLELERRGTAPASAPGGDGGAR